MSTSGPSNLMPHEPPPVTISDVCKALDSAGLEELDEMPTFTGLIGCYLLVAPCDLRIADMCGRAHYVDLGEDGCARLDGDVINNLDELGRLADGLAAVTSEGVMKAVDDYVDARLSAAESARDTRCCCVLHADELARAARAKLEKIVRSATSIGGQS